MTGKMERRRPAGTGATADRLSAEQGKYSQLSKKARRVGRKIVAGNCVIAEQAPSGRLWDKAILRMREVERVVAGRFGGMIPPTEDAEPYVRVIAFAIHALKQPAANLEVALRGWCGRFAPHLLCDFEFTYQPIRMALEGRRFGLGDVDAGRILTLTWDERSNLELRTIDAADVSKDEQQRRVRLKRRERNAERKRAARLQQGATDRRTYLAAVTSKKPWEEENVSRATYFRRRKAQSNERSKRPASGCETGFGAYHAEAVRLGSALSRNIHSEVSELDSHFGSADEPSLTPPMIPILEDLIVAPGRSRSAPARGHTSCDTIISENVEFVATAGSHELPACVASPPSTSKPLERKRVSK